MVSLRRRRLLGLCSGNNWLVTQLPLHRENLTLYENSSQNANNPQSKQSVVSDIASILDNVGTQNSQNTIVIDEPGSSNVSCSNPSKEQLSQQHIENMKSLDSFNNLEVGKNVKARPVLERVAVSGSRSNAGSPTVPPPSPLAEPSCAVSLQTDGATVAGPHPLPPPSNTLKRGSEIVLSDPSHKQTKETVSNPSPTIQVAAQVCSSSGCLPSVWAGPPLILQHIGNMTSPIDKACLLDVSPVGIEKAFLENTVAIDESNVSCSSPSKEQPSQQNTGTTLSEQELPHPSDLNYSAPVQALKEDPMPLNKRRKLISNSSNSDSIDSINNSTAMGKSAPPDKKKWISQMWDEYQWRSRSQDPGSGDVANVSCSNPSKEQPNQQNISLS
ncbi:hypothetical protein TSUD_04870 [Trifolium subterraneum]|uniref:Uncharacterized protein n=1 Tax=Trifolium subterraneum TaxID=3900 RepID=A0A2Z6NVB6_TRISU|nr:hypothetical protein TSUD_04870 [Trifolium subterraneum]